MPNALYSIKAVVNVLAATRKERQVSQSQLGKFLGLPQSHISDVEQGKTDIRLSTLIEISRVLGLELMLIPREMVPAITSLCRSSTSTDTQERPAYSLDSINLDNE